MTRIRVLGITIAVRSFALGAILMITIGVTFVVLYGEGVIGLGNRVADALLGKSRPAVGSQPPCAPDKEATGG
jgi:hypothetical protein